MKSLDSDLLRTFLAIQTAGSVTGGADTIGRSQSATSLQVRQLEEVVGQPLFKRHGRGVALTHAGERLAPVARAVVQSLDAIHVELRGGGLAGKLRIGMPDDGAGPELAGILAAFANLHPDVELDVQCSFGGGFAGALTSERLDLAVFEVPKPAERDVVLRKSHLVWMGRNARAFANAKTLPIAVYNRDCWWRDLALSSLEDANRPHQIAVTSESASGLRAAVLAGIAVGILCDAESHAGLKPLSELTTRLPSYLVLRTATGARGPVCDAMCDAIRTAFKV